MTTTAEIIFNDFQITYDVNTLEITGTYDTYGEEIGLDLIVKECERFGSLYKV